MTSAGDCTDRGLHLTLGKALRRAATALVATDRNWAGNIDAMDRGNMETLALGIDGMQHGACAARVERQLYSVAGVQSAAVSLVGAEAEIAYDPRQTDAGALARAVAEAGYAARVLSEH